MAAAPSDGDLRDGVQPFTVEALDVRGRVARLGPALDALLGRHDYPEPVARVVAEAAALVSLLGTNLKSEGRFQLQTRSDGPIDMLVVDFDAPDRLRAVARFDGKRLAEALARGSARTAELLGSGHLAMTIDQGSHMSRYQGLVALDGQDGLEGAAHRYFRQSEQIPTRIRLATARIMGQEGTSWSAGAIMAQFLPVSPERQRQQDLDAGDDPNRADATVRDIDGVTDDAWAEARALIDTVEDHELVDPLLPSENLLFRLFHERGVRVFSPQPVREACRCSHDGVLAMLRRFNAEDRAAMVADDGMVQVTCEFCSRRYRFRPRDLEAEMANGRAATGQ